MDESKNIISKKMLISVGIGAFVILLAVFAYLMYFVISTEKEDQSFEDRNKCVSNNASCLGERGWQRFLKNKKEENKQKLESKLRRDKIIETSEKNKIVEEKRNLEIVSESKDSNELKMNSKKHVGKESVKLSQHETVAVYTGIHNGNESSLRVYPHREDKEWARFDIVSYINYTAKEKGLGDKKQETIGFKIDDLSEKNKKFILNLKRGDLLKLSWDHVYVTVGKSNFPERNITKLEKLKDDKRTDGMIRCMAMTPECLGEKKYYESLMKKSI